MTGSPPRSARFDLAIAIVALATSMSFFVDAWAHGHEPVETFFTPYHGAIYGSMLAGIVLVGVAIARNRARGYPWSRAVPDAYRWPLLGMPLFALAGLGDLTWHHFLGVEEGVDALLSPTHQALGFCLFLISSGPIRSALAAPKQTQSLGAQLPWILALATWIELIHFGTAYAFDPAAGRANAPLAAHGFTPDALTLLTLGYYQIGYGVLVVIFQSALMAAFALFVVMNFRPRFGALTILYVLGNVAAAAAFTNDTPLLATTLAMSVVAGLTGDTLVLRTDPRPQRRGAYRAFAFAVPFAYFAAYFLVTSLAGGVWWDWNVMLGATLWAGAIGLGLSLLLPPRERGVH